ncbi:unnamed protein product [Brassica oleracea]
MIINLIPFTFFWRYNAVIFDDNCDGSRKNVGLTCLQCKIFKSKSDVVFCSKCIKVKKRYCYAELVCESLCLSRVFLATTWNVGGRTPNNDLNLEDFLLIEGRTDLCICGYES